MGQELDFLKVLLVFLFVFGAIFLALLFTEPKQRDYYSALYLLPGTLPYSTELSTVEQRETAFDQNKNCYTGLPNVVFSYGIKNSEQTDLNYELRFFAAEKIEPREKWLLAEKTVVSVKKDSVLETEKSVSIKRLCLPPRFYLIAEADSGKQSYEVHFIAEKKFRQK